MSKYDITGDQEQGYLSGQAVLDGCAGWIRERGNWTTFLGFDFRDRRRASTPSALKIARIVMEKLHCKHYFIVCAQQADGVPHLHAVVEQELDATEVDAKWLGRGRTYCERIEKLDSVCEYMAKHIVMQHGEFAAA